MKLPVLLHTVTTINIKGGSDIQFKIQFFLQILGWPKYKSLYNVSTFSFVKNSLEEYRTISYASKITQARCAGLTPGLD